MLPEPTIAAGVLLTVATTSDRVMPPSCRHRLSDANGRSHQAERRPTSVEVVRVRCARGLRGPRSSGRSGGLARREQGGFDEAQVNPQGRLAPRRDARRSGTRTRPGGRGGGAGGRLGAGGCRDRRRPGVPGLRLDDQHRSEAEPDRVEHDRHRPGRLHLRHTAPGRCQTARSRLVSPRASSPTTTSRSGR